ncbi:Trigger factor [Acaryochloris thomasi RCC1774]|uniref:Trigger factor n=1 Tax=Acaryochloris thomasi RCC1774 TaxID=1764569 RepID=A0A2W1JF00_9CYAN|nr:Trigger factor [Acaryochloris thomasi RCC1774]
MTLRGKALSKTQERLNVTQSKLPGSQVSLEIEIPGVRSQQAYEQVITKFMRSAQIPGFRRGKIPRQVILQRFGTTQIKAAALEDLIQNNFEAAVKQEEINALGGIQLQSSMEELVTQYQPGEALTFTVSVEVPPEVKLNKHQGFEVTAEEVQYDPAKVEEVLAEQQSQQATLVPVEGRAAEKGDVTQIDFASRFEDGDDDTTEEVKDFQLELIENGFITDLVNGVVGMGIGDTKEIPVTFPDDFFQEDWAGRSAIFTVTLNDIKTKELPELDDDFAQDVSEFSTLAELREFLEERYQKEAKDATDANVEAELVTALVTELEAEPPPSMIQDEVNVMINETAAQLQSQGIDVNKLLTKDVLPGMQERLRPEAQERLKTTLALAEVAKLESLTVEPEALEKRTQEVLESFGDQKVDQQRLRNILEEELLKEAVMEWLKEHSEVKLVESKPEEDISEDEPAPDAKPKSKAKAEPKAKDQVVDVPSEAVEDAEASVADSPKETAKRKTTKAKSTKAKTAKSTTAEKTAAKPKASKSTKKSTSKKAPPADAAE